jgi:ribonuclease T1
MRRRLLVVVLLFASATALARSWPRVNQVVSDPAERRQVLQTLDLIERGGPFPFPRDGIVFSNRERRLPSHGRGYYHEYTVPTPGAHNRGARRIIRGDRGETYYTRDHYETFVRIDE